MPSISQTFWKYWYRYLSHKIGEQAVNFLNYGYWPDEGETIQLEARDEPDRLPIQLYHHVASGTNLQDRAVLEVSCGHGGGASFIRRYHRPAEYTAIDQNPGAIAYCRQNHAELGIRFKIGDAQVLDFPAGSFDAVVNVEASHCYPDQEAFARSVYKVLRPGGHFLFADFRPTDQRSKLEDTFRLAGFQIIEARDITADVLRALKKLSDRYTRLVEGLTPRFMHGWMRTFAAVDGSSMHRSFENGERSYLSYTMTPSS